MASGCIFKSSCGFKVSVGPSQELFIYFSPGTSGADRMISEVAHLHVDEVLGNFILLMLCKFSGF